MPSEKTNEATRREWRELGFFYDRDDVAKEWRVLGTIQGLNGFAQLLRRYASDPRNNNPSEHEHFGPYMYLEIGTWGSPEISNHWIAGPVEDLLRLSSAIEEKVGQATPGDRLRLGTIFAPDSAYDLVLEVRDDAFDPASADTHCG